LLLEVAGRDNATGYDLIITGPVGDWFIFGIRENLKGV